MKSELFLDHKGNDLRIIYKSESKSARQLFDHFVASLADYITQGSSNARDNYASLRRMFGVGPDPKFLF